MCVCVCACVNEYKHWQRAHTSWNVYYISNAEHSHSHTLLLLENTAKIPHAFVLFHLFPWKTSCLITLDERNMYNNILYEIVYLKLKLHRWW